eukprot:TRINITY_DN4789_c1_g1_i4.p2 TRINITY_DN4789_c1_g1~~TRINITY_DN4789_c1_g1_i4.p2  ORF type:complete len:152 (-),score=14.66 TRINITY_DN4789_c1_g1_i4:188-643(-)
MQQNGNATTNLETKDEQSDEHAQQEIVANAVHSSQPQSEGLMQTILHELTSGFTEYLQNTCTPKLAEIESKFNELQSSCEQTLLAAQQEIQQREEYIFHKFEDMRNFQEQMQQIFNNVSNMQGYDTNQHQQNGDAQEVQEQPIVKQNILEE